MATVQCPKPSPWALAYFPMGSSEGAAEELVQGTVMNGMGHCGNPQCDLMGTFIRCQDPSHAKPECTRDRTCSR